MMDEKVLHAVIFQDGESEDWVAMCLELDVVTQGDSEEHAKEMLKEAVELHLEDLSREDLETLFQPIHGEPKLTTVRISAPSLLN
jgi:predicted RNase H-like HicB family nuclease